MNDVQGREVAQQIQISEFDAAPVAPVAVEIGVHNGPISGMVTSADGSRLLVTNYADNSVSVVSTDTCRVIETIYGIDEPFVIALGPAADRAYVSTVSTAYDSIAVIDLLTHAVVATHPLAHNVRDLAISPDGSRVYAARIGATGADIAVLDATTGRVDVIDVAAAPGSVIECLRVSPDGNRLYIGLNGHAGGRLVVIGAQPRTDEDAGRARWRRRSPARTRGVASQTGLCVLETVAIGLPVRDVALSPDGATAYVASSGPDGSFVVDGFDTRSNKITSTRKVGEVQGIPTGLTLSRDGRRAYLVTDESVTVLCTRTDDIIGTLGVVQPSCVVESPDGTHLYIGDYAGAITMMPIYSAAPLAIETARPDVSAAWVSDLARADCEPALA